jgi:acyl-CoA synthetase (AMP-forming)/AMP-acid ligase II
MPNLIGIWLAKGRTITQRTSNFMNVSSTGAVKSASESERAADRIAKDNPMITEADTIRHLATIQPDHTAMIFNGKRTSYRELDRRASQVAAGIAEVGVPVQKRVGILAKNSDEYFELFFGLVRANRIALPINWRLAVPEIAFILQDAEVTILFIDASFRHLAPELQTLAPGLRKIIILGDADSADSFRTWRDRHSAESVSPVADPSDVMIQFYTSGTTGKPKGVQITHYSSQQMRLLEVAAGDDWAKWGPTDVAAVALPNFHLSGTSWSLQWFARGATCVVQEQVDPGLFLQAIQTYGVTHLFAVPTVLGLMLEHPLRHSTDFSSLKLIFYGGAPISPQLLDKCLQAFSCDFIQLYGMTETNGVVCFLSPADHKSGREYLLKSCGKPYPMADLRIMDGSGRELPADKIGEICVKTPAIMKGYWKREVASSDLAHGEFYRTGDAGYKDKEGYVFLVDRLKDMIVSGGENIYPAEIEHVLLDLPGIKEIAVIGVPDDRWGEAAMAIVVRLDPALSEQDILAFARKRIAGYKIPKSVKFIEALPRNAAGKVLKRQLRDEWGARLKRESKG